MTITEALSLIRFNSRPEDKARWADLGCGSGTFTRALAEQLADGSTIIAVDSDANVLRDLVGLRAGVGLEKIQANILAPGFSLPLCDGILMANFLHYVHDQVNFINAISNFLAPTGVLLIVEYDTNKPNPWVPYPVSFSSLQKLLKQAGFSEIKELAQRKSQVNEANMYAAIAGKAAV